MNVMMKWVLCSLLLTVMGTANAQAVHGVLRVVKGDVQIKAAKDGQTARARLGGKVYPKDIIITAKDARAKIVMVDNNEINVSPESQIEIQNYEYDPAAGKKDVLLNVIYGKVRAKVEQKYDGTKSSKFQVKTPSAVAGVRGTDFLTGFDKKSGNSQVVTFHGKVEFGLPGPNGTIANPVMVTPGTFATASNGAPPKSPTAMPKDELAKMDGDTKADPGKPGDSGDQREPAGDKKDDKDEDKENNKDGDKKDKSNNRDGEKKDKGPGREPSSVDSGSGGGDLLPPPNPEPLPDRPPEPPTTTSIGACGNAPCPPPPPPPIPDNLRNQKSKVNITITPNTGP